MSKKGHMIWVPLVVAYWALAFVVGSAIPQVQTITGLIAAVCILHVSKFRSRDPSGEGLTSDGLRDWIVHIYRKSFFAFVDTDFSILRDFHDSSHLYLSSLT
jgi:hypothetical protein